MLQRYTTNCEHMRCLVLQSSISLARGKTAGGKLRSRLPLPTLLSKEAAAEEAVVANCIGFCKRSRFILLNVHKHHADEEEEVVIDKIERKRQDQLPVRWRR